MFIKSIVVCSLVLVLHITHCSLVDSPRATSSPESSTHGGLPYMSVFFLYLLDFIFTYFPMFRSVYLHKYLPFCYNCLQYSVPLGHWVYLISKWDVFKAFFLSETIIISMLLIRCQLRPHLSDCSSLNYRPFYVHL